MARGPAVERPQEDELAGRQDLKPFFVGLGLLLGGPGGLSKWVISRVISSLNGVTLIYKPYV